MKLYASVGAALAALTLTSVACARQAPAPYLNDGHAQHLATETLTFGTAKGPQRFRVQVADNDPERELGLMYVRAMPDHDGMVFDFPAAGEQAFWMKDTFIPLDIIYVATDGRVLSIAKQARPHDETPLPSHGSARAVVEINGGLADRLGIAPGDKVTDSRLFPAR